MHQGEMDLRKLLAGMNPELHSEEFVYAVLPSDDPLPQGLHIFGSFVEDEGMTLILARREAERYGLPYGFACRRITLTVHSSLEAVGFLAAIAAKLAETGVPANTISAYYHDHLFVPSEKAEQAMAALRSLAKG